MADLIRCLFKDIEYTRKGIKIVTLHLQLLAPRAATAHLPPLNTHPAVSWWRNPSGGYDNAGSSYVGHGRTPHVAQGNPCHVSRGGFDLERFAVDDLDSANRNLRGRQVVTTKRPMLLL